MQPTFDIKFRKEKRGPEFDLVVNFLNSSAHKFYNSSFELTQLIEPYAEAGIPDVLLIIWDKTLCKDWKPERNQLTKFDIKILHHISKFGKKGVEIDKISRDLNLDNKHTYKAIHRLITSNLVDESNNKSYIKNLNENFFIKKIISIEAKIGNWKNAFHQAQLNENFSSHSYVLLPIEKVSKDVLSYESGNTGLLAQDGKKLVLKKKAKKTQIPGSYFSWILNEYLGRQNANAIINSEL